MQQRNIRLFILLPIALVLLALTPRLWAQATAVRSRTAEVSSFVGFTSVAPDYGGGHNEGLVWGADYMWYLPWLSPAIEARYKITPGGTNAAVGQTTFGGGIRIEHQFSYFHPYADFMVSNGWISFAQDDYLGGNGVGHNTSVVYSYGGGLDYDFARQWAIRADYQGEHWNLEETPPITLTPRVITVGILYRFRFHKDRGE
jgi:hypothetical protein